MGHAGLRQHVPVKAPQTAVAARVMQDPVATDALVHHAQRAAAVVVMTGLQPAGKLIRPAPVGIDR